MIILFTLTIFLSALLLFMVQPMAGKMLLPFLGGTPAVWNTCMMFFQAILLLGYLWSHWVSRLKPIPQVVVHVGLLAVTVFALPLSMDRMDLANPLITENPVLWLLGALSLGVGLPFLALSTTSPLIQAWFARMNHKRSKDPYFLYAASNAGSLIALLGYPLLVEPVFGVSAQRVVWSGAFAALVLLIVSCAALTVKKPLIVEVLETKTSLTTRQRLLWTLYAFVPSSLLLGVTTYITTDVAAFPLLWVIPLAIYVGSFIIVFSSARLNLPLLGRVMSLIATALLVAWIIGATSPDWIILPLHVVVFALATVVVHGRLAASRPSAEHLTAFYLHMSIGGALGGIFNTLIAPAVFERIWEYPLIIVLACALRPQSERDLADKDARWKKLAPAVAFGVMLASMLAIRFMDIQMTQIATVLLCGVPAAIAYSQVERPLRLGVGLLGVLLASTLYTGTWGNVVFKDRSFFGTVQVVETETHIGLVHGGTIHGRTLKNETECTPLSYFHPLGPVGSIFDVYHESSLPKRVGIIGLGLGAQACYGRPEDAITFYELDPTIVEVAKEYGPVGRSLAGTLDYVVGDARIQLQQAKIEPYGMFIVDAFSSDSIPIHLMTVEAFALYLERIVEDGILAVHISNRYFDLKPVVTAIAKKHNLHMASVHDSQLTQKDVEIGRDASAWMFLSRDKSKVDAIRAKDVRWEDAGAEGPIWTDDHANIFSAWRQ